MKMEYEPPKNMPDDEQKLWITVSLIKKAISSQSRGKCNVFIWDLIPKGVDSGSIDNILDKLEHDEKVLKVVSKPKKLTNNPYDEKNNNIVLNVDKSFDEYYKKLAKIFGLSVEGLNDMNCLKVLDVATEMAVSLNITDENTIRIPLLQLIIRFRPLFPGDTIDARDKYCDYRYESVEFLKKIGAIEDFKIHEADHRWQNQIEIKVKRLRFFEALEEIKVRWRKVPIQSRKMAVGISQEVEKEEKPEGKTKGLSYSAKDFSLLIGKYKVQIPENTAQSELCRVIFEDSESMAKEWSYDELHKMIEGSDDYSPNNWRKYYNAANSVNDKIALETHIKKFLKPTKKLVKIDDDYLEKYSSNKVQDSS